MKIKYIELNGCHRFKLNEFTHFSATYTNILQIILGTNGSGKSSLVEMLTPLPPNPSDFAKDGSKIIHIEDDGKFFEISTRFGVPHPHCFIVDGVEKNDSHNITAQRELVKKYFGITPETQKLLMGNETFTRMRPERRKEILLKLSDAKYDYPLAVYMKLKERYRDLVGAQKIASNTLVRESEKLISDEETIQLKLEINSLHELLNGLLEIRKPIEEDMDNLRITSTRLDKDLISISTRLLEAHSLSSAQGYVEEQVRSKITQAQEELFKCSGAYDSYSNEFGAIQTKLAILNQSDMKSVGELRQEIANIQGNISDKLSGLRIGFTDTELSAALPQYQSVIPTLAVLFSELPLNPDKKFTSDKHQMSRKSVSDLRLKIAQIETDLSASKRTMEHQEEHKQRPNLSCPKCTHKFSSAYDGTLVEKHKKLTAQNLDLLKALNADLLKENVYCEEAETYAAGFREFHRIRTAFRQLVPYWIWLTEQGALTTEPQKAVELLEWIRQDLEMLQECHLEKLKLTAKKDLLKSLESLGSVDTQALASRHSELSALLEKLAGASQSAQNAINQANQDLARILKTKQLHSQLLQVLDSKKSLTAKAYETTRRSVLNQLIRQLQSDLALKESKLNGIDLIKKSVQSLTTQIADLNRQATRIQATIKILSPSEGLIAEGMLGFINSLVTQMNDFIEEVWTYPMFIESCKITDGETIDLDYKFPLFLPNRDRPLVDVSEGSAGMLEIIDLAFRFVAMRYMGLANTPIFLDEFGKTFDAAHKNASIGIIKTMISDEVFPQVFLISHDFHQYGVLANAEITLLNSLNVAPPSALVNKHVVMS